MEVKSNPISSSLHSALSELATFCGFMSRAVLSPASARRFHPVGDAAAAA